MDSIKRHRLAATSSLVLLWAQRSKTWQSPIVSTYLDSLDLDDGLPLLSSCNEAWIDYRDVIINRKYTVLQLLLRDLTVTSKHRPPCRQVVIMGAGMDPLSLELAARVPGTTIYDVDVSNMTLKHKLIGNACAKHDDENLLIHCISGDLSYPSSVMKLLEDKGWDRQAATALVLEGMSYYVSASDLRNIISEFSTPDLKNRLTLEYLTTPEYIAKERAAIPEIVFGIISEEHIKISRYAPDQIRNMITMVRKPTAVTAGSDAFKEYTLRQMSKNRIGHCGWFKQDKSGWIRICHVKI